MLFIGDIDASCLDHYIPISAASGEQAIVIESQEFTVDTSPTEDLPRREVIGPKTRIVLKEIRTGKWDVIVLTQDVTRHIANAEEFHEYKGKLNDEIKQADGDRVLFFIHWAAPGGRLVTGLGPWPHTAGASTGRC